jgi:hypothetical protein
MTSGNAKHFLNKSGRVSIIAASNAVRCIFIGWKKKAGGGVRNVSM